jgi:hypothetical protein
MKLNSLFKQIESIDFSGYFIVANGIQSFMDGLANHQDIQQLIAELHKNSKGCQSVYERISALVKKENDALSNTTRSYDIAVAGYLYTLNETDAKLAALSAEQINRIPRFRWAALIAKHILVNPNTSATKVTEKIS